MNTESAAQHAPYTSVHESFYIPYLDPPPTVYPIDESNPTLQQILDDVLYDPSLPVDPVFLDQSYDPWKIRTHQILDDVLVLYDPSPPVGPVFLDQSYDQWKIWTHQILDDVLVLDDPSPPVDSVFPDQSYDQWKIWTHQILDDVLVLDDLSPPVDLVLLDQSYDPRKTYSQQIRKITMESLCENGSIVGGPHRLPPKPILFLDVEAEERMLESLTQLESSLVICPFTVRRHGEGIGIDPLETVGIKDIPAWRHRNQPKKLKSKKCLDPIRRRKEVPRKARTTRKRKAA